MPTKTTLNNNKKLSQICCVELENFCRTRILLHNLEVLTIEAPSLIQPYSIGNVDTQPYRVCLEAGLKLSLVHPWSTINTQPYIVCFQAISKLSHTKAHIRWCTALLSLSWRCSEAVTHTAIKALLVHSLTESVLKLFWSCNPYSYKGSFDTQPYWVCLEAVLKLSLIQL